MSKIKRNAINGVLLLDKPSGISSNQALFKVKKIIHPLKIGHTGTLDPLATGLLPICLGEATKFARFLLDGDKEYLATAQLGVITDSGDSDGQIIAKNPVVTDLAAILACLTSFLGKQQQLPPMYSALKHQGRPLYEYARAGIEIERDSREIIIHQLELVNYDANLHQLTFRALVSKGTYIRTLAEDIGANLGCGASLIALARIASNQFNIANAVNLSQLEQMVTSGQCLPLLAINSLTANLKPYVINPQQFAKLKFGNPIVVDECNYAATELVQLFANNMFLGVAGFLSRDQQIFLQPKRLISDLHLLNL